MNAITKKTISYFERILGMTLAVLCVITLRFAIWEPELLQKIFSPSLDKRVYIMKSVLPKAGTIFLIFTLLCGTIYTGVVAGIASENFSHNLRIRGYIL